MKKVYTLIALLFISLSGFSQGYEFALVYNSGFSFSVIAVPDFSATNTDVSDIGFTLMLPAGSADVTNVSTFNGRVWIVTEVTAAQLSAFPPSGLGDGTRDATLMVLPPGQTILSHTTGVAFTLVTFDISNMPTSGVLEILLNSDPIAVGLGGAFDSFYNSNIDGTTTQNYFSGIVSGMGSFNFATLGVQEVELSDVQLSIYPNPASEVINIQTNLELTKIELFDVLGKRVLNTGATNQLNIEGYKAGIYFLKVHTTSGKITKKLVIE